MKKRLSIFIGVLALFLTVLPASAADPQLDCSDNQPGLVLANCYYLNGNNGMRVSDAYSTPAELLNIIVRNLFVVAGILLFVMILIGAFNFITGDVKGKDKGLETIKNAAIGFAVMFSAYWIIQILAVVTGIKNIGI